MILTVTGRFFLQKFQSIFSSKVSALIRQSCPTRFSHFPHQFTRIYLQLVYPTNLKKNSILFQYYKQAKYINEYEQHNAQTQIQHITGKLSTLYQLLIKGIHNAYLVCYAHYDTNCHMIGFFSSNFYSLYMYGNPTPC